MRTAALSDPRRLEITGADGQVFFGADQEWYRRLWCRKAGCGPTAASVQLAYLAAVRPELFPVCPMEGRDRESFVDYMEEVWEFVTPGPHGLNKIKMYTDGVRAFAAGRGVPLSPRALSVPKAGQERPGLGACVEFIRAGLLEDCPVAFLNLCNGEEARLDKWHWVLITAMEETDGGQVLCTIADSGAALTIDLGLWHATTKEGGGFVYLPREVTA